MESRQSAWVRSEEQHAMDVDSPTASLKRLLEAKAAREAKISNNSKKTKSNREPTNITNTQSQEDQDEMEIEEIDASWSAGVG